MGNLENFYSCTHMQDSTPVETSDFETYNVLSCPKTICAYVIEWEIACYSLCC